MYLKEKLAEIFFKEHIFLCSATKSDFSWQNLFVVISPPHFWTSGVETPL